MAFKANKGLIVILSIINIGIYALTLLFSIIAWAATKDSGLETACLYSSNAFRVFSL
jgi:hypothetical protein